MEQCVRLGSTTASQASLLSQIRFTVPMWMELDTGFSIQDIDFLSKLHAIWVVGDGPIQSKWKTGPITFGAQINGGVYGSAAILTADSQTLPVLAISVAAGGAVKVLPCTP